MPVETTVHVPRIEVDLDAIRHNVAVLRRAVERPVLAVVKAGAYGHDPVSVARAALAGGAEALGVVDLAEALALRTAGIDAPIAAWMHGPSTDWIAAIEHDIDLGVSSIEQLQLVASAAEMADRPARVHLKLDTGLGRNGAHERDWGALFAHMRALEAAGVATLVGAMSHLSGTSRDADLDQVAAFERARVAAERRGVAPERWHLAATAAGLDLPEARFDLVRLGIAMYGLSAGIRRTPSELGLRPGLRLVAPVVRGSQGFSIELGTADGLPPLDAARAAGLQLLDDAGHAWALGDVGTLRTPVRPLGAHAADTVGDTAGDTAGDADAPGVLPTILTLIGDGDGDGDGDRDGDGNGNGNGEINDAGSSGADRWAEVVGTIGYEIVTRLSPRVERRDAATGEPLPAPPPRKTRTSRGLLAPHRTLLVDVARLRAGLEAQAAGGDRDFDVSADAYGLGLAVVAPLAMGAGLRLVAGTTADVARARAAGFDVQLMPDVPASARAAYGFDGDGDGNGNGDGDGNDSDAGGGCVRLVSELVLVKRVGPGSGVSYGHEFVTERTTTLGLVPIGYADGLPRRTAGSAVMRVLGEAPFDRTERSLDPRVPVVGRVAMDQVVLDLGAAEVWAGVPVVVFGDAEGDPSLAEVAAWAGVEPAAFVAALGPRVERVVVNGER